MRKYFQNNLFRTRKIICLRFLSMLYKKVPSFRFNRKNNKKIRESNIMIDWKISMLKKSIFLTFVYYYWLYFDKFYVNKKKILKPYDFATYTRKKNLILTHTKIRNLRVFVLEKKYLKKHVTFFSQIFFIILFQRSIGN